MQTGKLEDSEEAALSGGVRAEDGNLRERPAIPAFQQVIRVITVFGWLKAQHSLIADGREV